MNYFANIAVLLCLITSAFGIPRASPEKKTIEELVAALGEAFAARTMSSLDADKPYVGSITVVIEHSLSGKREKKVFKSFAKLDEWLKKREHEDLPARNNTTLKRCKSGVCTYDVGGLLHNNLYIKKVTYGGRTGHPYIRAVHILDGD